MLSLSDIQGYIREAPAIKKFKPWWDQFMDILIIGLFMIMILCWTRIYSMDSGGFICIYLDKDNSNLPTQEMRYIDARCFLENDFTSFQFYPYILLIQWGVLFICHVAWIYIPTVESRLRFFDKTIDELLSFNPQFEAANIHGILPKFDYSFEDKEQIKLIHEKITFMALEKSYLSKMYRRKTYILILIILIFISSIFFLFTRITFLQVDFKCNLNNGLAKKNFSDVVCNISTSLYIYGFMLLHSLIMFLMIIFALKALFWHFNFVKRLFSDNGHIFEEIGPDFKGLPGYIDLVFLLELFRINTKDGNFKINVILYILSSKYTKNNVSEPQDHLKKDSGFQFNKELCLLKYMASELGLQIDDFSQEPAIFFKNLEQIRSEKCFQNISIYMDIKIEIKDEILNNLEFYSILLEKSIKNGNFKIENDLSTSDYILKHVDGLCHNDWPDRLVMQAVANVLGLTIVIVSLHFPKKNDPLTSDIIEPINHNQNSQPVILGFVPPHYFYFLPSSSYFDSEQENRREMYIYKQSYRNKLRREAIRSVERFYESSRLKAKTARFRAMRQDYQFSLNINRNMLKNSESRNINDLLQKRPFFHTLNYDPRANM